MNFLTAFLQAIASVFGWSLQRSQAKNTPAMQDRAEKQAEADANAKINQAIKDRDLPTLRKELSE